MESKSVAEMEIKSLIEDEKESEDPFVKALYRDLEQRLQDYENDGSNMERLKLSDLKAEVIMAVAITGFLISVII